MFSIVGAASASDLTHTNSTSDTHSETISHDNSPSSAPESHATQLKSSSDNKEKTATNDEITSSSQIDEKEITTQSSEEKTTSSNNKTKQSTNTDKLYKSSKIEDKLGDTIISDVTELTTAISNANDGDTIYLQTGTYNISSSINLNKTLTIIGSEGTIINKKTASTFSIPFDSESNKIITIKGLTFTSNDVASNNPLINVLGPADVRVIDCTFTNMSGGKYGIIRYQSDSKGTIDNCLFKDLNGTSNANNNYISILGNSNVNLKNSNFTNIGAGTFLRAIVYVNSATASASVDSCIFNGFSGNTMGVVDNKGTMNISGCTFTNIDLMYASCKGIVYVSQSSDIGSTIINTSLFTNNNMNYAIYISAASTTVEYSAFNLTNDQTAVYKDKSSGSLSVEKNWYNNKNPNNNIILKGTSVIANTWIIEDEIGNYQITDGTNTEALTVIIPGLNDNTENNNPETNIIYVSETGLDTNDGLSLENATTLSHALNVISNGGTIKIFSGNYTGNGYEITKNLTIIGIGTVKIDANNLGQIFNIQNSNVTIDNLILINGKADKGGAIYLSNSNITITNTTFKTNNAEHFGGAIYVDSNSDAKITKSVFINNAAKGEDYFSYGMYTGGGDAVYNDGKTTINYSILITDYTAGDGGRVLIHNNNIDNEVNAQNNWWGNINIPGYIDTMNYDEYEETSIDTSNEIILTLTPTDESIYTDGTTTIKAEFKIEDDDLTEKLPTIKINTTTNIGTVPQEITIKNNQATFTYTAPTEKGTATIKASYDKLNPITTTTIEVKEPYTGPIYVSQNGDDNNNGTEESPVATISKAIDLTNEYTSTIVITEGTYTGNGYHVTKSLTVIGQGQVTLDANNEGRFFYMDYGDSAGKIELHNLTLTNAKGYGAAVYSFADELILDNVTIVNNQADGYLIKSSGKLTIKDSEITKSMSGNVIEQSSSGDILINNTLFQDNSIVDSTSVYGVVYISSGSGNLVIENSQFINNTARQGVVKGNANYGITVKNSTFINNTNTAAYGGAIYAYGSELNVENSTFINNNAYKDGGAIYVSSRTDARITRSTFINNTAGTTFNGDAIYNGNKLSVNYSILLTNANNYLIYNDGEDNIVNAKYNYWGTNDDPKNLVASGYYEDDWDNEEQCGEVDVSNWILMTITANENMDPNTNQEITVDFKHYKDEGDPLTTNIPELNITATTNNGGTITPKKTTKDNEATFTYTAPNTPREIDTITFKTGTQPNTKTITINNIPEPVEPTIIYVKSNGNDENDGLTEDTAVKTIEHAITLIQESGKIIINEGTYEENGLTITKNINITGKGKVTIDAKKLGQIFNIQNSNVTIDNLTLISGKADKGGAIYLSNSNITITNTTFKTNNAEHFGGAIYVDSNSDAKITKSVFINNAANGDDLMHWGGGDAVYNSGKTTINYSLLITDEVDSTSATRCLISNNNTVNEVNAQYNWWANVTVGRFAYGFTEDMEYFTEIDTSNEIILTLTPTDDTIYTDGTTAGTTTIKVEFKVNGETLKEKLPTITINATSNIGTIPNEITIKNNEATVTYTSTQTGDATIQVSYDRRNPITTTTVEVKEQGAVYNGIIYVSKTDASDDNEGSETKPVASIAKAIELAQAGSGKIMINEGIYEENGLTISQNINITTNGNVIINAKNLNNIFNVTNNAKLVLNNLKLINGKADKGGAIFVKSGSSLEIVNVTFENNNATNGGAIYINTNTNVKVTESAFIKNNATNGGAIYVTITNQYEAPANVNITKTKFINNTAKDGSNSNAIYTGGKTNINYCILLNHNNNGLIFDIDTDNTLDAKYNWWGTNTPDFSKLVEEYYYWVDEWETYEAEIDTSHWVVMNVTPVSADLHGGESQDITVDFTKDNTGATLSDHIPELDVTASVTNGELNTTKATTKNNQAKFKYTAPSTGEEDTITFNSGNQITTVPVTLNNEIPEPTTGIVYVSTAANANDYNEGTEEKPVATIAKAIDIATSATGSKKIIILDGTYIANGIVIDSDLNITGKGNVIWDANGFQAFNMTTNHILTISNIKFTNGNGTSNGHLFRVDNGEISIDNCKFVSNGGNVGGTNGIIYINKAKLTVTNSIFENNTAGRGTSYGVISVRDGELYVDNCNFTNNYNKNGMIYIQASNIGSTATIKNSKFIGNNATSASGGSGAGIYIVGDYTNKVSTTVLVDNCDFINNTAKGGTYYAGDGGAIHVANNATLIVSKSNFINNYVENNTDNTLLGKGGAIYAHAANVKITESLFKNNFATLGSEIYMENLTSINDDNLHRLNVTKSTFNSTSTSKLIESNYNNGKLFAIGNTWINTEDPSTRVSEGIIVKDGKLDPTITINVNNPTEGEKAIITVNTGAATGNVTITIEGRTPETVNITNGIATLNTTELTAGTYNITVTYNGDNKYNAKTENTTITIKSKTTPPGPGPTPTNVVIPETISNFFDENGVLKEDVPDELVFSGEFKNLTLTINKPMNITGDNAVFNNTALNITADNVKVSNIKFVADETFDKTALISTTGKNTTIENNTMTITGNTKATGIFAENATIAINNNNITTASNNTMVLNNTNGTINNNTLKAGNNINGSASISQTGCNVTIDNGTSKPDTPVNPPENPQPQPQPSQPSQPTTPSAKESENSIPAKQIKITTPKTPKKISKKAKKLTIRVKLKVKGKLAKNKKVIIIIKGKTYKKRTNRKGIAKLTLKKAKLRKILRKIKVGKKLTYKVKYGKKTIKRSIKVKK